MPGPWRWGVHAEQNPGQFSSTKAQQRSTGSIQVSPPASKLPAFLPSSQHRPAALLPLQAPDFEDPLSAMSKPYDEAGSLVALPPPAPGSATPQSARTEDSPSLTAQPGPPAGAASRGCFRCSSTYCAAKFRAADSRGIHSARAGAEGERAASTNACAATSSHSPGSAAHQGSVCVWVHARCILLVSRVVSVSNQAPRRARRVCMCAPPAAHMRLGLHGH